MKPGIRQNVWFNCVFQVNFFLIKQIFVDTQPPAMKCPESYVLPAKLNEEERHVVFNETTVAVVIHDSSNVTELKIQPAEATLKLNTHVEVEVLATDSHGNQNSCKFQVAFMCKFLNLQTGFRH